MKKPALPKKNVLFADEEENRITNAGRRSAATANEDEAAEITYNAKRVKLAGINKPDEEIDGASSPSPENGRILTSNSDRRANRIKRRNKRSNQVSPSKP